MSDGYEKFVRGVHAALLLTALAGTAGIVWIERGAILIERHVDGLIAAVDPVYLHQAVYVAGGTVVDLEKTLKAERKASADQLAAAAEGQQKLNALLDRATQFVAALNETNATLNTAIADQDRSLLATEAKAGSAIDSLAAAEAQLDRVLANAAAASESAAQVAADPHLKDALAELDQATSEADTTLAHLSSIAASGDRDAQMLETRLRQALKPASLAKSLFERALGIAGPAAQIATAAK